MIRPWVFGAVAAAIPFAFPAVAQHQMHRHDMPMSHEKLMGPGSAMPARAGEFHDRLSDGRHFRVSIDCEMIPMRINVMHSWIVTVATPDGKAVNDAKITVDGGMPAHGHGLPTAPRVTRRLGDGKYLVEGMKFNMSGHWVLRFALSTRQHSDTIAFDVTLN